MVNVTVTTVGILRDSLPDGEDVIEKEHLTVQGVLDALVERYGPPAAKELLGPNGLHDRLSMLVNGRNVLSLENTFQAHLNDGDEVVITVLVPGG